MGFFQLSAWEIEELLAQNLMLNNGASISVQNHFRENTETNWEYSFLFFCFLHLYAIWPHRNNKKVTTKVSIPWAHLQDSTGYITNHGKYILSRGCLMAK